jgi:NADH-quinone oxidoreductase subunit E
MNPEINGETYAEIFNHYHPEEGALIPILQRCQERFGFISPHAVQQISQYLKISENRIFGVASFYSQFRFDEPGKNSIRVCLGTACHVQGGQILADEIQRKLCVHSGQTTADKNFDYQEVACLGCCAQAAVVQINGEIFAKMNTTQLQKKLEEYE